VLASLVAQTRVLHASGDLSIDVGGVSADSRAVRPGDLFVACPGLKTDGKAYVDQAIREGAVAVVCEPPAPEDLPVPVIVVPEARKALADVACAWYGHPSRHLALVGVTGTDGKTTTTHLVAALLNAADLKTGLLSTVALDRGRGMERNPTANTTPEALVIQRSLAEMRAAGLEAAALEVSSHALVIERVRGCVFDCAIFTNLDPEHLDFHGTLANYRAAKALLFAQLDRGPAKPWGRLGVVNGDDPSAAAVRAACSVPCVDFGLSRGATIRGEILKQGLDGTTFRLRAPQGQTSLHTTLCGPHNVLNWLGAIGAGLHFGVTLGEVRRAAEAFPGVPGRLEPVRAGQPFHVFVDFAHTPQALAATLSLLRRYVSGRLIVVFGQAGNRDIHNRSRMAKAVADFADLAIVSNDDPYDEDPEEIVDDLARGLARCGWREDADFWRIVDRREAIQFAIARARRGDCVLLAGRGPEEVTVIGGQRIPLSDAAVAREALGRKLVA
jgi:UDP-N-acetylmuramoyl-L-alanyl-D-glutamate--2,6-diaminopimelate ligase